MRVQNLTKDAKNIYEVGPSSIAFTLSRTGGLGFPYISEAGKRSHSFPLSCCLATHQKQMIIDTIIAPGPGSELGCEDPRVVYDKKTKIYYMFYTSVTNGTTPSDLGKVKAMLSLAVNSGNPYVPSLYLFSLSLLSPLSSIIALLFSFSWTELIFPCSGSRGDWKQLGYVFPELQWSKSGTRIHTWLTTEIYIYIYIMFIFIYTYIYIYIQVLCYWAMSSIRTISSGVIQTSASPLQTTSFTTRTQ